MKAPVKFTNTNNKPKSEMSYGYYTAPEAPVTYQRREGGTFVANIFGYIEEPAQYADLMSALEMMEEHDDMVINLQSGGGCVSTTDMLVHSLRKTKGHVHFIATGQIASAATILLLEAHSFELSENFAAMCHCGSTGAHGTLSEFRQAAPFQAKYMEKLIRNTYKGFLTDAEIESMIDGKDVYLDAEQWLDRSEKRNEYYKAETEKLVEAMNKAAEREATPEKPAPKKRVVKAATKPKVEVK